MTIWVWRFFGPLDIGRIPNHNVLSGPGAQFHRLQLHSHLIPFRPSICLQGRKGYLRISTTKLSSKRVKVGREWIGEGIDEREIDKEREEAFFPTIQPKAKWILDPPSFHWLIPHSSDMQGRSSEGSSNCTNQDFTRTGSSLKPAAENGLAHG